MDSLHSKAIRKMHYKCPVFMVLVPKMKEIILHLPNILDKFTTRPWAFLTSGRKVFVTSIIPHRLTSAMRLDFSSGIHSIGPIRVIPALFTSPHRPE